MEKHLVIIDDCDQTLELFLDFLEDSNFRVSTFVSPEKAFKTMKVDPPHLLVIDYVMPGINGVEFIQALRENMIYTGRTFIITAKSSEVKNTIGDTIPNLEIFPKPIDFKSVTEKISKVLETGS